MSEHLPDVKYLSRERVQELAIKSGLAYSPGWIHDGRGRNNLERFMELVVDEITGRAPSTTGEGAK